MARDLDAFLRKEVTSTPFCPGCGHGMLMNIILRAIADLNLDMKNILFVSGIGCAAWIPSPHFNGDTLHTLHGRAIAFATGAKMANPKLKVIVISGDGDLTSIGGNHLIHAARRNTPLTVICANNMIYGMTGGQVASTSPRGTITATTADGNPYHPFDLCRLVLGAGAEYAARFSVTQPLLMIKAIKKVLNMESFTFIEALSPCPTQYGRRNRADTSVQMLKALAQNCISREQASNMDKKTLKTRITTGEFTNE